jgi:hypothetical protein
LKIVLLKINHNLVKDNRNTKCFHTCILWFTVHHFCKKIKTNVNLTHFSSETKWYGNIQTDDGSLSLNVSTILRTLLMCRKYNYFLKYTILVS